MIEVERKYRVDGATAERIAKVVGASSACHQLDEVYLIKSDSWSTFRPGEPVLRIRVSDKTVTITVKTKGPKGTEETEVPLPDLPSARALIRHLGATHVTRVEKIRRQANYRGLTIAVDHVDGLGDFVELETIVHDDDQTDTALQAIDESAHKLGLKPECVVDEKYDTLLERLKQASVAT